MIGMLCGVMVTAAFTYAFAIPANDYHWRWEIWNRGGAVWCVEKDGHLSWKWMTEWLGVPKVGSPRQKHVTTPAYEVSARREQL